MVHVSVGVRIGLTLIRPLRSSCDSKWTLRVETTRMVPSGHAATERLQSFIGGTKARHFLNLLIRHKYGIAGKVNSSDELHLVIESVLLGRQTGSVLRCSCSY